MLLPLLGAAAYLVSVKRYADDDGGRRRQRPAEGRGSFFCTAISGSFKVEKASYPSRAGPEEEENGLKIIQYFPLFLYELSDTFRSGMRHAMFIPRSTKRR